MVKAIIDKIVADKKVELSQAKMVVSSAELKTRAESRKTLDFKAALMGDELKLIAEVKKASPSKGLLCPDFQPVNLAKIYRQNGAAAISVLTEVDYFQGSLKNLAAIRKSVDIPLLRKDFIFDEYQVYEAKAYGADAILLITAILEDNKLKELLALSKDLRLDCLVEVHNEEELQKALLADAEIIGINNRDLRTFKTDINTTRRLRLLIPPEVIVVSESGIHGLDEVEKIKDCKVNAILVGEALVTAKDIPMKMEEFLA